MNNNTPYYIKGDQPEIIGDLCQGFCLNQQQENSKITDPANVSYFKFSDKWIRLYFEGSTIFWSDSDVPTEPVNDQLEYALVLVNLNEMDGIVGSQLETITYEGDTLSTKVTLVFSSSKTIKLEHFGDSDITKINF